jgi:hypothetical protein
MNLLADRLIVRFREGAMALSAETGNVLWRAPIDRMLDGQLIGSTGPLLFTAAEQVKGENNFRPVLIWIDPATGSEIGRYAIEALKHEKPKLGPLLVHDGKIWALFGRGEQDPNRDLVQLTPKADVVPAAAQTPSSWSAWSRHVDPSLQSAVATVLPGWTMLDGRVEKDTGLQAEWQGQKQLLNTLAAGGRPLKLIREVSVPRDGNPRLVIKVAGDPQGKWKLQVNAGSEKLFEQAMNQETTGGALKDFSVDLAKFKGRDICLVVRQIEEAGPQPYAKWKQLDIIK